MKVLGYDMYPNKDLDFVEYVDLDTLLSQSDLISLHCPLMEETHHMINIDTIQKMKDGVILVNTSRGGLIKTDDLIQESARTNSLPLVWMCTKKRTVPFTKTCPRRSWSTRPLQGCYLSRMLW